MMVSSFNGTVHLSDVDIPFESISLLNITRCGKGMKPVTILRTTRLIFVEVASLTFALLEILSTLPEEVKYVWPNKMSLMKLVFFVNKYSVLVDATLAVMSTLYTKDPVLCEKQFQALAYAYVLGTLVSEAILATRTMAVWAFHPYIKLLVIGAYLEDLVWVMGCEPGTQDRDAWPAYGCLMVGETGILVLTILKRWLDRDPALEASSEGVLFHTMYRDGTFFYFIVLGISILNLLVMLFAPQEQLTPLMQMPLRVVHSALCTRVLLNLRKAAAAMSGVGTEASEAQGRDLSLGKQGTLQFAPESPAAFDDFDWDSVELSSPELGPEDCCA
ncbi:hypothetical protein C8Q80DRAFT_783400 [Daedaleopsis nitida]|nr:hypothetical protein C8Q80DRAFT_783400 [Daedaleopsis nitida]